MIYGLLLSGAVRAAIVLALGLGVVASLGRAAAATRRFVLVLTLGASIVVPVAAATSPRWRVEAPAAFAVLAHESEKEGLPSTVVGGDAVGAEPRTRIQTAGVASRGVGNVEPKDALLVLWLVVAAALLARAVASQLRARGLARRAVRVERGPWIAAAALDAGGASTELAVEIRASSEVDSPAVMGLLRGTLVVPQTALDWPPERCRLVLVHELAHVRRRDVLAQALADVACALHWCNPFVWICARRLRVEREIAADDAVLAAGVRPSRYAEELVAIATSAATPRAALAIAERSSLEARVTSVLAAGISRAPLAARGTAAVITATVALAVVAACTSPEVAAAARVEPVITAVAPRAATANDGAIQRLASEELAAITKEWSPELAVIVVLDPATGEILANAGSSDVAIAPGSTLKPITIAAALERHAITVDQKFDCGPAPRMYGTREFHDASPNGTLDLAHLLAVSSNIGMTHIFDALGGDNFSQWLHRFHFDAVPEVATGSFEGATAAIGQRLTATPLQMVAAYGAFANDGVYHAPTRGGSATGERLLSADTARSVMALLETAVVDETATGKAARVDGVHVAGKTGTAEWTAPDGRGRTYASFIGIADLPSRRVVALVGIQAARDDLYGGASAAPAFARLVRRIGGS